MEQSNEPIPNNDINHNQEAQEQTQTAEANEPIQSQPVNQVNNVDQQPAPAINQVDVAPKKIEINGTVLDNKCPNCGAPLFFNAETENWKCNYCDSMFNLEQLSNYNNASNAKYNEEPGEIEYSTTNENIEFVNYTCENCGAQIVADEQTTATFCVYCGNTAILKNKLSGEFAPDLIIPFKKAKKTATEAFKGLSKCRPLMPKGFNDEKNIEKIRGVYIPFWLYDMSIAGTLNYNAQKITSWTRGDTVYTKTDTYHVVRDGVMSYQKIPMDASTRFDNNIMNSIEPFDYQGLKNYNHAYLSGFLAEKYDDDENKIREEVTKRAINSTITQMDSTLRLYSSKMITLNTLAPSSINKSYALLPVWMVNVKYNNKQYIFAMNGQTGKFIGDIPIDKKKAIIIGLITFLVTFAIVIIISIILFLAKGGTL